MNRATVFAGLVALALVTSCSSAHPGKVSVAPQTVHHDVTSILDAIGAESHDGGHTYSVEVGDPLGSCAVTAVLPDAGHVADGLRKGERVATNAGRTIGLVTTNAACVKELSRAVKDVS